jgi:hypothetical protein
VRGRRQGLGPLNRPAPAAMDHGARALPPWATALGILLPWATAAGILPLVATTAEPDPIGQYCRPLEAPLTPWPTAAGTPSAVGHDARCTFVENFDSTIYFSKIMTN